mmetsp:Transcript_107781/g.300427  ORF Transcript_107781/g.300427 Transcript_107781/m.300427 type:complete len:125 (-) Transcript_107781:358-732(-)
MFAMNRASRPQCCHYRKTGSCSRGRIMGMKKSWTTTRFLIFRLRQASDKSGSNIIGWCVDCILTDRCIPKTRWPQMSFYWCRKHGIVCRIRKSGFFTIAAVWGILILAVIQVRRKPNMLNAGDG